MCVYAFAFVYAFAYSPSNSTSEQAMQIQHSVSENWYANHSNPFETIYSIVPFHSHVVPSLLSIAPVVLPDSPRFGVGVDFGLCDCGFRPHVV